MTDLLFIFKSIIIIIFLLYLIPIAFGFAIRTEKEKNSIGVLISSWTNGFMLEYALFGLICVMLKLFKATFHMISYVFILALLVAIIVIAGYFFVKKKDKDICVCGAAGETRLLKKIVDFVKNNPAVIILTIIVIIQFVRTVFYENISYLDDKSYNTIVKEIIRNNQSSMTSRTFGNSLYEFEAFLSFSTGLNYLLICNTIWRGFVILLLYGVIYVFGDELFSNHIDKKIIFCTLWAVFIEATFGSYFSHDTANILRFANWAKGMIIIWAPLFCVLLYRFNQSGFNISNGLLAISAALALCLTNNGGSSTVFIIVVGETISYIILNKKCKKAIIIAIICMIPALFQIISYTVFFR